MKKRLLVLALLLLAMLTFYTISSAATDPIVCTMEVSPTALSEPGDVTITITISNSSDTDMQYPLTLFDPTSQIVTDFGDNGSATLKAGEVKTWTGKWNVNQRTLENGRIVFFVKYQMTNDDGTIKRQSQPINGTIEQSNYTAKLSVTRTITPLTARDGQTVTVIYNITNEGNVTLTNVTLNDSEDIIKEPYVIDELEASKNIKLEVPIIMGKEDRTSKGTVTYTIADGTEIQTYDIEEQVITYAEPAVIATLSSDSKGVLINGTIKLNLELDNTGNVDYTDVRISDDTLGDVFTNQTLPAGEKLNLEKEITLPQSTDYTFKIYAIDKTGTEVIFESNTLSLIAVDPDQMLNLAVTLSSNKTEVYSDTEAVRFTVSIFNDSSVDATNVKLTQAGKEIASFASIPAGEARTFSRDVTLSMAGKYQFEATALDTLENTMTFQSNVLQIAFLTPTPAPITPNPNITPTPEPTFVKATYPKASDPDIATLPKMIRTFFYPLMIAASVLLIVALIILLIATLKRSKLKKMSENAVDHLERSNHRDYVVPADEQEPIAETVHEEQEELPHSDDEPDTFLSEDELPHMKYVRNAYQIAGRDAAADESSEVNSDDMNDSWNESAEHQQRDDDSPYRRRTSRVSQAKPSDDELPQNGETPNDNNP